MAEWMERRELDGLRSVAIPRGRVWQVVAGLALAVALLSFEPTADYSWATPDEQQYVETARNVADGDGYVIDSHDRPRFPPGFPLLLAPLAAVGDDVDTLRVFPPLAWVALVALMWFAALELAGPAAAAATALLVAVSPGFTGSTLHILSDLPAAALVCAALVATIRERHFLAGMLLGLSATLRLAHAPFVLAARRPRGWVGGAVVLVPLAVAMLWLFGSLSSYSRGSSTFELRWLWDRPLHGSLTSAPYRSIEFYPQLLLGRFGWLFPGAAIAGAVELWLRRRERVARFGASIVALNLAVYLVYYYQDARFMMPTAVVLLVFAGALPARLAARQAATGPVSGR